jgi:hypothetical protein
MVWWRGRHRRNLQPVEPTLEKHQSALDKIQPVPRPDRHHHGRDNCDRKGEQENDQRFHDFAPATARPTEPDSMSWKQRAEASDT